MIINIKLLLSNLPDLLNQFRYPFVRPFSILLFPQLLDFQILSLMIIHKLPLSILSDLSQHFCLHFLISHHKSLLNHCSFYLTSNSLYLKSILNYCLTTCLNTFIALYVHRKSLFNNCSFSKP